jgi:DNA-binding transcriptional regulator GbsR (MarR family)
MPRKATAQAPKPDNETFIQDLAALLVPTGMPPIAARMYGHLLLSKDPVSLADLTRQLGVSKSSVSVGTRILERIGIVRRMTEAGSKRVRYGISGRCDGFIIQQMHLYDSMGRLMRERSVTNPLEDTSERLQYLADFYLRMRDAINSVTGSNSAVPPEPLNVKSKGNRCGLTRR